VLKSPRMAESLDEAVRGRRRIARNGVAKVFAALALVERSLVRPRARALLFRDSVIAMGERTLARDRRTEDARPGLLATDQRNGREKESKPGTTPHSPAA
jgi:hypothetical protein